MDLKLLSWDVGAGVLWAVAVAGLGATLTVIGPWYRALKKPKLQPPDWLFGPAWTLILAMAAGAAVIAWRGAPDGFSRGLVVGLIALNGALNVLWNVLFFTRRRPDRALAEVAFLWLSILAPIVAFWRFAPNASLLLLPYLVWVGFASYLNYAIVQLNGPFGSRPKTAGEIERMRDA